MGQGAWSWIVPDGLWEIAKPLIPPSKVRPQGGGTQDTPDEAVFAAIVYVLVSGCAWRALPPCFGISKSTAHRRFLIWSRAGVWGRLHRAVLDRLAEKDLLDLSRVVLDTAHVRAKKGGELTGPSPVDRGKPGSKMHVLSDRSGLPLVVGISSGNTHDCQGLKPMIAGLQSRHDPERGRHYKPRKLHADKAYDQPDLRKWVRGKRIGVRIARKGIESSERLGRHRWVIERTMSWLCGYRRLSPRYERHPRNYLAFLGLAAALCCYKRYLRLTT
ncbi:IS5 family transposase [Streptomyces sp. NBC_01431]|uniref:IS5 family transposase n=1 Tax=Streptomyces sp. NBC_01431 TaxID=2903863 RepID=UPI002E35DCD4|nr:IS5 family transposase [Streptomyces sp. NBC_01431]